MNILVFNSGSSSLRYQLIDTATRAVIVKDYIERIGESETPDFNSAMRRAFAALSSHKIDAIGHRVVHGGANFSSATLVTDKTLAQVESVSHLAPLHNPPNLTGVKACREVMPNLPNVMVFDTAFHMTMPASAYMYAIPQNDYKKHGIRRYGFHGTSHDYVSQECAKLCKSTREKMRIISVHLGNGCSVCAIDKGKSIDTSMGLTPLEGLIMGTRSGDIDPAAIEYIAKAHDFSTAETISYLNKKCGLLGLTGSNDFRDLMTEMDKGNPDATTAFEMVAHRLVKYVGAYITVMNGCDAIIFTGGIGNNIPELRTYVIGKLGYMGAKIDEKENAKYNSKDRFQTGEITGKGSSLRTFAICTNEELSIALQTASVIQ